MMVFYSNPITLTLGGSLDYQLEAYFLCSFCQISITSICYNLLEVNKLTLSSLHLSICLVKISLSIDAVKMPGLSASQVTLNEVLEVRGGPMYEDELWALLYESCDAIKDLILKGWLWEYSSKA